jgi:hypothetical protein
MRSSAASSDRLQQKVVDFARYTPARQAQPKSQGRIRPIAMSWTFLPLHDLSFGEIVK